jgi:hypothetical protein
MAELMSTRLPHVRGERDETYVGLPDILRLMTAVLISCCVTAAQRRPPDPNANTYGAEVYAAWAVLETLRIARILYSAQRVPQGGWTNGMMIQQTTSYFRVHAVIYGAHSCT